MRRGLRQRGFSLIELLIIVVIIGIMAAIALQSMTSVVEDSRRTQTERQMENLSKAIVGNPEIMQDGVRSDFGYVGDVGAFPANLGALYANPGIATWRGPYVHIDYTEDTSSFKRDAWGAAFTYSGGVTITSTGHGSAITKKIAGATSDYLVNEVPGSIRDRNDSTPGTVKMDSVQILADIPNGAAGTVSRSYKPAASGSFLIDSVPAGKRFFRFIYVPANDTIRRYYTVLPRHKGDPPLAVKFAGAYFSSGGGGGCTGSDSVILRPSGSGSIANISNRSGGSSNWQCVDEVSTDDAASQVSENSNNWVLDQYALTNPPVESCTVVSVAVWCRAMRDQTQGDIRPAIHTNGSDYYGTSNPLTNAWANYSYTWATNPSTGSAWTWTQISSLEAGAMLRGQSPTHSARLTQVFVVVKF